MAPRAPQTLDDVLSELRTAAAAGRTAIRFGSPHHSHVIVRDDDRWCVRTLVLDPAKAEAYLAEHGIFMPEHAEQISEPGPTILFEAASAEALAVLLKARWPL